ncbi:hypothetical protein [Cupriavidus pauculus]|uniref:hypothetical protein n=1 Tax=Cupriavidus pauculus TaxID=82633 RepID=UPI0015DE8092|nr:hypothetical protein [Cupriavidus pauculus]
MTGTPCECKRTPDFSLLVDARPRIETMPLERAAEAYARLKRGDGKFRMGLPSHLNAIN